MKKVEILIIGGGLAGLTAALDLALKGKQVWVVEKKEYPQHKVCGEYVSNEIKPYLQSLGVDFEGKGLPQIDTLQISSQSGKQVEVDLPLGGFGISRFTFDYHLFTKAKQKGVHFIFDTVTNVTFNQDHFSVTLSSGESIRGKIVLGAFGKRSNLDKKLKRRFVVKKSPWLAVKGHYKDHSHPNNLVALHNFPGGYGGLSRIEEGKVNFCYLVQYDTFKKVGDIDLFNRQIVTQNPLLEDFIQRSQLLFEDPLSIAQISFEKKSPVEHHMLMCGDTAGLIHPLCGNGMAMAIHAAKLASEQVNKYFDLTDFSRNDMEKEYIKVWTSNFRRRIWMGRQLQALMMHTNWFDLVLQTTVHSKMLLRNLVRGTHGKPVLG